MFTSIAVAWNIHHGMTNTEFQNEVAIMNHTSAENFYISNGS